MTKATDHDSTEHGCGVCNEPVPDDCAMLCDGDCNNWFHISCANLTPEDYVSINLMADKVKWYCKICEGKVVSFFGGKNNLADVSKLQTSVERLLDVVKGLAKDNISLNEKFDRFVTVQDSKAQVHQLMGTNTIVEESIQPSWKATRGNFTQNNSQYNKQSGRGRGRGRINLVDGQPTVDTTHSIRSPTYTEGRNRTLPNQASYADMSKTDDPNLNLTDLSLDVNKDSSFSNHLSHHPNAAVSSNNNPWQTVSYDRNNKNSKTKQDHKFVIGTKSNEGSKLKIVPKFTWIFVSRLSPEVSKEDVCVYLKDCGIDAGECIELKPKFDTYKSFKIGVPSHLSTTALSADFWPAGTFVKEFVSSRPTMPAKNWTVIPRSDQR